MRILVRWGQDFQEQEFFQKGTRNREQSNRKIVGEASQIFLPPSFYVFFPETQNSIGNKNKNPLNHFLN